MKLVIGLGNPGKRYEKTRHNIGFMVIDEMLCRMNVTIQKTEFNGQYYKGEDFILIKPQTFMNLSGSCVEKFANYYKVKNEDILIIYDDMDLELGRVSIRKQGSAGGHNGMNNIIAHFHTEEINRIRIGIGHAQVNIEHVLNNFNPTEEKIIKSAIDIAVHACWSFLENKDMDSIMNTYNKKV